MGELCAPLYAPRSATASQAGCRARPRRGDTRLPGFETPSLAAPESTRCGGSGESGERAAGCRSSPRPPEAGGFSVLLAAPPPQEQKGVSGEGDAALPSQVAASQGFGGISGGRPGQACWGRGSRDASRLAGLSGGCTSFGSGRARDLLPALTSRDPPAFSRCRKPDPWGGSETSTCFRQPRQNAV